MLRDMASTHHRDWARLSLQRVTNVIQVHSSLIGQVVENVGSLLCCVATLLAPTRIKPRLIVTCQELQQERNRWFGPSHGVQDAFFSNILFHVLFDLNKIAPDCIRESRCGLFMC